MILKNGFRYIFVFLLGAVIYNLIEVIFRGYTHWSMSLAGGSVLLIFYILSDWLAALHPVIGGLTGALVITCVELTVGVIFNILLKKRLGLFAYAAEFSRTNLPAVFGGVVYALFSCGISLPRAQKKAGAEISLRLCNRLFRPPSPWRASPGRNPTREACTR